MHVLVLAPGPVDADTLRRVVGEDIDDARVLVVSAALNESSLAIRGEAQRRFDVPVTLATL